MFSKSLLRDKSVLAALALAAAFTMVACESEANPSGPGGGTLPGLNEIVSSGALNATSTDTLVYFSLAQNKLVARTGDWDIALRRYEVRLNGGVTGTKGVLGYSVDNNATATDAQVLTYTAANTLAAFTAFPEDLIPADDAFLSDRLEEDRYAFVNFAGAPAANAAAYWKVKTAAGGGGAGFGPDVYALMHVTAITYDQTGSLTSVSFETRLQTGATLAAPQQATVPIAGAPISFSIAGNAAVTPDGCNWDLRVDPQTFEMTTNAACGAGTFPGGTTPTFAGATSASDAAEYGLFLSSMVGPIPNSVTDASAPFRYNLQNDNRLYPSFNIYLVKVGANVYKMQVINYYSDAGASGYPTIRYARLR